MSHLSPLQNQLAAQKPAEAWAAYIPIIATCLPFWEQAVTKMAGITNLGDDQATTYRQIARGSFTLMNNWYFEQIPYIKARRNEIDTVISFIRNGALRQNVATRPAAAAARNLAGALRGAVHLSVHNYPQKDYPRLMASHLLDVAAAQSLFPVDIGDLVSQFALPGQPPSENIEYFESALSRGAERYGLQKELTLLFESLDALWNNRAAPTPWVVPDSAWEPQKASLLAELHYKGVQDFHARA